MKRRSMTSDVSTLSSFVAFGHQTSVPFPPPPLKSRAAGFPQYGFKQAHAAATFVQPRPELIRDGGRRSRPTEAGTTYRFMER